MKYRSGFVSNSSSCSFVLLGFKVDNNINTRIEILKNLAPEEWDKFMKEYCPEYYNGTENDKRGCSQEFIYEVLEDKFKEDLTIADDGETGYDKEDGKMVIGLEVARSYENTFDDDIINLNDFTSPLLNKMKKVINENDIEHEFVLLTGTKMC